MFVRVIVCVAIACFVAAPSPSQAAEPDLSQPLPRAGVFAAGINIDLLELGALQTFSRGPHASGAVVGVGVEVDLGPHAALRLPLRIGGDPSSFFEAVFAPAVVYRFRRSGTQKWVPFAGSGVNFGFFQFGRAQLGLSPSPMGTAQEFVRGGIAPEVLGGVLYAPSRLFSLRFAADYSYFFVAHTSLHAVTETITVRFSF